MTNEQAAEVILLIRAATGGKKVDEQTIDYFSVSLLPLDYKIALATATSGSVFWRFFPSWAEFQEIYRTQKKLQEPVGEQRDQLPPREKYGDAAPEWVWVWGWARTQRSPRNLIPFPQQQIPDSEVALSTEEYEALRKEWIEAGRPKAATPLPMTKSG